MIVATHLAANAVIAVAYIVAVMRVPDAFRSLIKLRPATLVSGAGFFLFCGMTHAALAANAEDALWVTVTDHLQAVAIVCFLLFLSRDLLVATRNLAGAYRAIAREYGPEVARKVGATIDAALQDEVKRPSSDRPGPLRQG